MADDKEKEKEKEPFFKLYNLDAVEKIKRDEKIELPQRKLSIPKDERWNEKQMASKTMQGILNGDSIKTISKSMEEVVKNNEVSAMRIARTMHTSAENAGRLQSFKDLAEQGVVQKKVWQATPDDRVRASHLDIDGEEQDIDKPFSNGCMFPGDGKGPADEVWNCRCAMSDHIIGFRRKDGSISEVKYKGEETLHDKQIREERTRRGTTAKVKEAIKKPDYIHYEKEYNILKRDVEENNIRYVDVNKLKEPISEKEIIDKISGGDKTNGSCASLALSYCGNQVGFDVTDYRGGESQSVFSMRRSTECMCKMANADVQKFLVKKEAPEVAKILNDIDLNRQYLLATGRHCAIVRRTEDGLQYLELQGNSGNGWWDFKKADPNKTLIDRFGCKKTADKSKFSSRVFEKEVILAPVNTFKPTDDFKEMLGYINTQSSEQKKGEGGYAK